MFCVMGNYSLSFLDISEEFVVWKQYPCMSFGWEFYSFFFVSDVQITSWREAKEHLLQVCLRSPFPLYDV